MAGVVGRAHGRQMDKAERAGWAKEFEEPPQQGYRRDALAVERVLDLAALHEAALQALCFRQSELREKLWQAMNERGTQTGYGAPPHCARNNVSHLP